MFRSLLVPVDGSPFSEQALPLAQAIARRAGAALELVLVHEPFVYYNAPSALTVDVDQYVRDGWQHYLERLEKRLSAGATHPVTSTFLVGAAAEAILGHAAVRGSDLVVMSTHGKGPLSRFWLGSVADKLMRRLPVPVVLVRPQEAPADPAREPRLQHLLVTLDGSELAEQILGPAAALAALMQAEVSLLRVVDSVVAALEAKVGENRVSGLSPTLREQLQSLKEEETADVRARLERVAEGLRSQSLRVAVRVAGSPHPAEAILAEATRLGVDLIALATQGRGGIGRLVLGSVADKVVRAAAVPVLTYCPGAGGEVK
jgi:nucleotide-binding universal stress UspA family protein